MNEKKFKTLDEQINLLKNKGLNINNESRLKWYLSSYNYQNFINGYNDFFMINNDRKENKYKKTASSNCIIELFNFDRLVSKYILSNIQNIERKISTPLAYTLAQFMYEHKLENGKLFMSKHDDVIIKKIFNIKNKNEWEEFLNSIKKEVNLKLEIFKKYKKFCDIPLWSLVIHLSFGKLIYILKKLNKNIFYLTINNSTLNKNTELSNKELISIFEIIKNSRNRICHNNVLYNISIKNPTLAINSSSKLIKNSKKYNMEINRINLHLLILIIETLDNTKDNSLINIVNNLIENKLILNDLNIKENILSKIWFKKN